MTPTGVTTPPEGSPLYPKWKLLLEAARIGFPDKTLGELMFHFIKSEISGKLENLDALKELEILSKGNKQSKP
jgi:hypothetical protein